MMTAEIIVIIFLVALYTVEKVSHIQELKYRDEREEKLFNRVLGTPEVVEKKISENKKPPRGKDPFSQIKKGNAS